MHHAQGSERLDQLQFVNIEVPKLPVAFEQIAKLPRALCAFAGKQHPQILDCRSHARVVEIDEMRTVVAPQNVAGMAISVQPDRSHVSRALLTMHHRRERHPGNRVIGFTQIFRNEPAVEQKRARRVAEPLRIQRRPVLEGFDLADRVNPADEAAGPFEHVGILEFRRAATAPRKQRDAKIAAVMKRAAFNLHRRHHRDLALVQFRGEGMFFEDLFIGPPARPVELGDDRSAVFDADLVYAVLVAVQRKQTAVAAQPQAFDCIQRDVRRQRVIRCCLVHRADCIHIEMHRRWFMLSRGLVHP